MTLAPLLQHNLPIVLVALLHLASALRIAGKRVFARQAFPNNHAEAVDVYSLVVAFSFVHFFFGWITNRTYTVSHFYRLVNDKSVYEVNKNHADGFRSSPGACHKTVPTWTVI